MRSSAVVLGVVILLRSNVFSQAIDPEEFLAPKRVTTFTEQKLAASINAHKHGYISDALFVQRSLAQYYAGAGDSASANLCTLRAKAAELILHPASKSKNPNGSGKQPSR